MKSRKTQEDYLTNLITRSILKSMEEEGVSLAPPGGAAPGGMGGGMGAPGGGMAAGGGMGGGMGAGGGMGGGMDDDDDDQMMSDSDEDQDMDNGDMDDDDAMNELKDVFTNLPKDLQEELINALTEIMNDGSSDDDDGDDDDEGGMDDDDDDENQYSDDNEDAPTPGTTKSVSSLGNREEYVLKSLASDYLSIRGATYDRDQERAKIVDVATKSLSISPAAFRAYANKLYKRR